MLLCAADPAPGLTDRRPTGAPAGDKTLYLYDATRHELASQRDPVTPRMLAPYLLAQEFAAGANGIVLIAADFGPTLAKYGPRGYRYLLLEAGHVGQNLGHRAES